MNCNCYCIPKCCELQNCTEEICNCKIKLQEDQSDLEIEFITEEITLHWRTLLHGLLKKQSNTVEQDRLVKSTNESLNLFDGV